MFPKLTLCCALLALACAAVRRDAPAPAAPTPLEELEKHAAQFQKTFGEQLSSLANSDNTKQLQQALKEGSDSVLQQLSAFSATLQGALADANGKAKTALETTRANIEKTTAELRAAHPEVEQQATALQQRLTAAVQQAAAHTQQLAKELQQGAAAAGERLQPQIKAAYDDLVKQAESVQKKLHEAATKQ